MEGEGKKREMEGKKWREREGETGRDGGSGRGYTWKR